jgi:hypothetical protein
VYGFPVSRIAAFLTMLAVGLAVPATMVMAQSHGHGGGYGGHGGPAAMGRPGGGPMPPGGRYAGPYGYAYRGGPAPGFPGYAGRTPYGSPGYPPGYAAPVQHPNSLGPDWRFQQEEARAGVRQGHFAPLGRVIDNLQRRSPGRQLDAGIEYDGGRPIYRVRWITVHGRRIDFLVDAVTGAVIGER